MGGIVQQTFLRHAAHGAEMLIGSQPDINAGPDLYVISGDLYVILTTS